MNKVFYCLIFFSFNLHALTFIDSMKMADKDFFPFFYSKYYDWQKEKIPCLCQEDFNLDKFVQQKLATLTTWATPRTKNITRQNFQILYKSQGEKITKTLILNISNSDLKNPFLKKFLKSLNVKLNVENLEFKSISFNYFTQKFIITYFDLLKKRWKFTTYQKGNIVNGGNIMFPSVEKSFSNKYSPYLEHFVHQEIFLDQTNFYFYRTYLKVLNILSLPKDLQLLMFRHKSEWSLDSVTLYTEKVDSENSQVGIYYP